MTILRVSYKNKDTNEIYTRDYEYNGSTNKKSMQWVEDANKIAFGNCELNEDVMDYKLLDKVSA